MDNMIKYNMGNPHKNDWNFPLITESSHFVFCSGKVHILLFLSVCLIKKTRKLINLEK